MLAKFTAFSLPDISQDLNSESEDAEQETFSDVNEMGTAPFRITKREPNTKTVFKKNKY